MKPVSLLNQKLVNPQSFPKDLSHKKFLLRTVTVVWVVLKIFCKSKKSTYEGAHTRPEMQMYMRRFARFGIICMVSGKNPPEKMLPVRGQW